jgi:preprotein translocase subunit SecG
MLKLLFPNLSTVLIVILLILAVALICRSLIRRKKQGRSSCGCSGCSGCAMHGACHKEQ